MSQGAMANKAGQLGESLCGVVLRHYGIANVSQHSPRGIVSVMGKDVRIDYWLTRPRGFEEGLYVEARFQNSPGSVDEKMVSLVMTIKQRYDLKTILVIDGEYSESSRRFATDNIGGNLMAVMTLSKFAVFCKSISEGNGESFIESEFNPNQPTLFGMSA